MDADIAAQAAGLDAITKPQGWHVWVSSDDLIYATNVRRDGSATTLAAPTTAVMRAALISQGVQQLLALYQETRDWWQARLGEARRVAAQAEADMAEARRQLAFLADEIAQLRLDLAADLLKTGAAS